MISFTGFADEFVKIAKSKYLDLDTMRLALKRLGEYIPDDPDDLKRAYRDAVVEPTTMKVPISERLKGYKMWKRTGEVPVASREGGVMQGSPFGGWEEGPRSTVTRSEKRTPLYSGGTKEDIRNAVINPRSSIDHPVYVPGQTEVALRGMYAAPLEADVRPYIGKSVVGGGTPTAAELSVPQSQVVQQGYQTVIPANARGLGIKKLRSAEESAARVEQATKKYHPSSTAESRKAWDDAIAESERRSALKSSEVPLGEGPKGTKLDELSSDDKKRWEKMIDDMNKPDANEPYVVSKAKPDPDEGMRRAKEQNEKALEELRQKRRQEEVLATSSQQPPPQQPAPQQAPPPAAAPSQQTPPPATTTPTPAPAGGGSNLPLYLGVGGATAALGAGGYALHRHRQAQLAQQQAQQGGPVRR